jgi:hypothetical protein
MKTLFDIICVHPGILASARLVWDCKRLGGIARAMWELPRAAWKPREHGLGRKSSQAPHEVVESMVTTKNHRLLSTAI